MSIMARFGRLPGVDFGVGELGPSETTRGWVTFEVSESAVIISIRVEYEYFEPVAIIVDLTE